MKFRIVAVLFLALSALLPINGWAEAPSGNYLYEKLEKPTYKTAFKALFKGQFNLEPWLKEYIKNRDGVDAPGETRVIGEKTYDFYSICQPHNCPGNVIYVLFDQGGSHAWAFFTKDDGTSRFFGNPDMEMQTVLKAAAKANN
jgi:Inhibitor of vertebrate lysozyme (Ivy)